MQSSDTINLFEDLSEEQIAERMHQASLVVAERARDKEEASTFLEMLGLIADRG